MNVTVFNPAQLQVLEMMSFVDSPEALAELKKAISDYFAKQAQKEIDRLSSSFLILIYRFLLFLSYRKNNIIPKNTIDNMMTIFLWVFN